MTASEEYHNHGMIATILFHGALLLLLLFISFSATSFSEGSIIVDFGSSSQGTGSFEPRMSDPAMVQQQQASARDQQQNLTQDYEESVAMPDNPNVRPTDNPRETQRETNQQSPPVEQQLVAERTPDQRAMFPGSGNTSAPSQGAAGGQGNQGSPTGAPNVHVYGEGIEVGGGLAGRGISGNMPRPAYNVNEQGTVVVEVRVNGEGNVTNVRTGVQGTTTWNNTLHEAARRAALQTKFNRSNIIEQTGTITYHFRLQGE